MSDLTKTLAIVGGGASGLSAAIAAGFWARKNNFNLQIDIYEKDDRVGRSILATGNGRCNFSNSSIEIDSYHNSDFVKEAFESLKELTGSRQPVHDFFRSFGLVWREEADGRQFPLTNKASTVLDVLRGAAEVVGVDELCESEVAAIDCPSQKSNRFTLRMNNGVLKRADAVIIACGGRTVSALSAPDMQRIAPKPILGPLAVSAKDKELVRELDNIRVRCKISLKRPSAGNGVNDAKLIAEERGELMFRKYGVSGICVFDISRFMQPGDYLFINFLDGIKTAEDTPDYIEFLTQRQCTLTQTIQEELDYATLLRGLLLPRISEALLKTRSIHPRDIYDDDRVDDLANLLSAFPLKIEGIADTSLCQVRRGGFDVHSFSSQTLESKRTPFLFAAGEALDVDGPCGGYNLQWAWSSGLCAGITAAQKLKR